MTLHVDQVFAPLDRDHDLERIGGGNETEVYRTDDHRYVVKLKCDETCDADGGDTLEGALARARAMRAAALELTDWLGPRHTIPSQYVVARDGAGRIQVLVLQPYVAGARPLHDVDYAALGAADRERVAEQLRDIVRRARAMYRATGHMPDLYGRTSASAAERRLLNSPRRLPWRLWSFLVRRSLLRAHNLLLTDPPDLRVVLVDYDRVRRHWLYRRVYYTARWWLFRRDLALIAWMRRGGHVPGGARPVRRPAGEANG